MVTYKLLLVKFCSLYRNLLQGTLLETILPNSSLSKIILAFLGDGIGKLNLKSKVGSV